MTPQPTRSKLQVEACRRAEGFALRVWPLMEPPAWQEKFPECWSSPYAFHRSFARPGWEVARNEPLGLVRCTLEEFYEDMVYDHPCRCLCAKRCLRSYVELDSPPAGFSVDFDVEFPYPWAPDMKQCDHGMREDSFRRWRAFHENYKEYLNTSRIHVC
ncbi:hypothetical protein Efla_006076 [Eimeria flavescens]